MKFISEVPTDCIACRCTLLNVEIKDVYYFTLKQDMSYDTEQPPRAVGLLYMPPELTLNAKFGKYPVVVWILNFWEKLYFS